MAPQAPEGLFWKNKKKAANMLLDPGLSALPSHVPAQQKGAQ